MSEPILTANELDALRDAVDGDGVPESGEGRRITGVGGVHFDGDGLPRFRFGEGPVGGTQREERLSYVFERSARMLERRLADVFQRRVTGTTTYLKVTRFAEFRDVFEVDVRELAASLPWEQGSVTLFGKRIPEPRLSCFFGDAAYRY